MPILPNQLPSDPSRYYAYVWRLDGVVIYVGCGHNKRALPTIKSGWSRPEKLVEILKVRASEIKWMVTLCRNKVEAMALERKMIKDLKPIYNIAPGSGGYAGMHSAEGLERISKANTGRVIPEEVRLAQSLRMLGNTNLLGHSHSEETRKKISEAAKGRPVSELCRQKSSERAAERNRTNPPRKGKKCSAIHRLRLSIAAKNRKRKTANGN